MPPTKFIQRKGATSYAIGLAIAQIAKAVLRDQNRVLTVSTLIDGPYDIHDVCLSLPAVINRQGATRVLNLSLSQSETEQLQLSGKTLRQVIEQLNL